MPTGYTGNALKANGECWVWGYGPTLGNNTTTNITSPVQVVGNHRFIQTDISSSHSVGVKDDGTTWCWGTNFYGNLGDNTVTSRSSPVQVVGGHSFVEAFCGYQCSIGLKASGQAWTWGRNDFGQAGNQQYYTSYSSPVQVVGNHSFIAVFMASQTCFGLKDNGQVWGWGRNQEAQIGNNSTGDAVSPVQVVGNHVFIDIKTNGSSSMGLKANGEVWSWGVNNWGQLGHNTLTNTSSPVKVIGNHSFESICMDYNGASYGIKSDGRIWAWGVSSYGELGTGAFNTSYSSPVQVVGSHSFISMYSGNKLARALKADGSVWSWGLNDYGQCGNGVTGSSYNSPVQVIGNHSFTKLMSGMSIKTNVSGAWRNRPTIFVNISGTWMRVKNIYVKKNNVWNCTDRHCI